MPDPQLIRAVSGHYIGTSIEHLFVGRPIRRSILLRDPVSHIISYYNYRMMRYLSQGLQTYSFKIAYGSMRRNFITHFILRYFLELRWSRLLFLSAIEKFNLANHFLSSFWFVGDYARCGELIAALGPDLGAPPLVDAQNAQSDWESRTQWRPIRIEEFSDRMLNQFRKENELDQVLWERWRGGGDNGGYNIEEPTPHDVDFARMRFMRSELVRPLYQIQRRFYRARRSKWGNDQWRGT